MEEKLHRGTVSFVHHQKHYATIEYKEGEKKRSINFQTGIKEAGRSAIHIKDKKHIFRSGDTVSFEVKLTPRGDRLNAFNVKFLYNNELDKLLQKARTDNRFKGFLKMADESYFVKELHSYLFFPLLLSQWEIKPPEHAFNEAYEFRLVNADKQNIAAELIHPSFIPAYRTAMKYYRDKTVITATVTKVSPYAVYLDVIGKDIQAKLPVTDPGNTEYKPGSRVNVIITYLGSNKIAVEKAG